MWTKGVRSPGRRMEAQVGMISNTPANSSLRVLPDKSVREIARGVFWLSVRVRPPELLVPPLGQRCGPQARGRRRWKDFSPVGLGRAARGCGRAAVEGWKPRLGGYLGSSRYGLGGSN